MSSKLVCLLGIALAVITPGNAHASYQYERPTSDRYDPDDYRNEGRRMVRCESNDRRTHTCNVDTRGGVRLVRQLSDRRCIRGSTWGDSARGIWVTDGCRADFEIGFGPGYGRVLRCESREERTVYCRMETRYGVHLVTQLSRRACVRGRTWGLTGNGIWVGRGCRGEFRAGDEHDSYDPDRYDRDRYDDPRDGY